MVFLAIVSLHTPAPAGRRMKCRALRNMTTVPVRPIVCVCELNDVAGIVLRSDYDAASKAHWNAVVRGEIRYDPGQSTAYHGTLIPIPREKIFVFGVRSMEHKTVTHTCGLFLERATFLLPIEGTWNDMPDPQTEWVRFTSYVFSAVDGVPESVWVSISTSSLPEIYKQMFQMLRENGNRPIFPLDLTCNKSSRIESANRALSMIGVKWKLRPVETTRQTGKCWRDIGFRLEPHS